MLGSLGFIIAVSIKISDQCSHGDVRLVNGTTLQEGRLEICYNSNWGTVCQDGWGDKDSFVVCRQLGYKENAGRGIYGAYFGQGRGSVVFGNVGCNGMELKLLNCTRNTLSNCGHNKDVSVRCILRDDQRIKNMTVSANVIDMNTPSTVHTALISWALYNTTMDEPISFDVECSDERHSITMSVRGQNFSTHLTGLLPLTSYNCCVSAVYELYRADGICDDEIETPELFTRGAATTTVAMLRASDSDHDSDVKIVGGVLGFIVMILLVLLITALVLLLLPRWKINAMPARNNTVDMPVRSNQSYTKAPAAAHTGASNSTTQTRGGYPSNSQAVVVSQFEDGTSPDYSSFGPDYETIDSRKQPQRKGQVPAGRLSERYEYSEAHLATLNKEGFGSADYEAPLNLRQNLEIESGDYSHLKH